MTQSTQDHYTQGERLEQSYQFREAYREFLLASEEYLKSDNLEQVFLSLVRSGLCLERSQDWRALSALWEMTGNRLGESAYPDSVFPSPQEPGQSGMFHIIPWTKWSDPENGYYDAEDIRAKRKHQQFWAYLWAAEALQVERHHRKAAENFRKAAAAVIHSSLGDRDPDTEEGDWTRARLLSKRGIKYKLAADYFFKAIKNDILAYGELKAAYSYQDIKWTPPTENSSRDLPEKANDLDRLHDCWSRYREIREALGDTVLSADAADEELRQLAEIQHLLRIAGNEKENRLVFSRRRLLEINMAKGLPKVWHSLKYVFLDSSLAMRIAANGILIAVLTCIVIPWVYYRFHFLTGADPAAYATFNDSVLHSLASTVTMSIDQIHPTYPWGQWLTVVQSFLLFFFLAYIVFVWTKKPEE